MFGHRIDNSLMKFSAYLGSIYVIVGQKNEIKYPYVRESRGISKINK